MSVRLASLRQLHEGRARVLFGLLAIAGVSIMMLGPAAILQSALVLLASSGLLLPLWFRSWRARDLRIELTPGALEVREGSRSLHLEADAFDLALRVGPRAALLRRGGWSYRLQLADGAAEEDLDALLAHVPASAGTRPTVVALGGIGGGLLVTYLAGFLAFAVAMMAAVDLELRESFVAASILPPFLVVLALSRWLGRSSLTVDADGILVREGRRRSFFPYRALRSVTLTGRPGGRSWSTDTVIQPVDGEERLLRTPGQRAEVEALVTRIRSAIDHHRATSTRGLRGDVLERGGRSVARWRADLAEGGQSFRSLALPSDQLLEVLDDPHAPREQRIGAALALRATESETRARIRVAATATTDRAVRVALEAVAEEEIDDARLEAALRRR